MFWYYHHQDDDENDDNDDDNDKNPQEYDLANEPVNLFGFGGVVRSTVPPSPPLHHPHLHVVITSWWSCFCIWVWWTFTLYHTHNDNAFVVDDDAFAVDDDDDEDEDHWDGFEQVMQAFVDENGGTMDNDDDEDDVDEEEVSNHLLQNAALAVWMAPLRHLILHRRHRQEQQQRPRDEDVIADWIQVHVVPYSCVLQRSHMWNLSQLSPQDPLPEYYQMTTARTSVPSGTSGTSALLAVSVSTADISYLVGALPDWSLS